MGDEREGKSNNNTESGKEGKKEPLYLFL